MNKPFITGGFQLEGEQHHGNSDGFVLSIDDFEAQSHTIKYLISHDRVQVLQHEQFLGNGNHHVIVPEIHQIRIPIQEIEVGL